MGRQDFETETLLAVGGFPDVPHSLRADGFDASEDGTGHGTPLVPVAFNNTGADASDTMAVRRLTPRECERLQGFPDDYTKLSGQTADGPRYKALGNSMAVPVMRWIGERIKAVDAIPGDYLIAPPVKPDQTLEELLTEEDVDALALPPELEAPGQ